MTKPDSAILLLLLFFQALIDMLFSYYFDFLFIVFHRETPYFLFEKCTRTVFFPYKNQTYFTVFLIPGFSYNISIGPFNADR
jgi:hypothetical protein